MVEGALAHHLVERDVGELGSRHRAHETVQLLQAGQGRGIRHTQFLTLPSHGSMGTEIRMYVKQTVVQSIDDSPDAARRASTDAAGQGRMGRVTAPEPHNPPLSRRAARLQRERDAERALEADALGRRRRRSRTRRAASATASGRRSDAADRAAAGHRDGPAARRSSSAIASHRGARRDRSSAARRRRTAIAAQPRPIRAPRRPGDRVRTDCIRPPAHTHSGRGDSSGCAAYPSRGEDGAS